MVVPTTAMYTVSRVNSRIFSIPIKVGGVSLSTSPARLSDSRTKVPRSRPMEFQAQMQPSMNMQNRMFRSRVGLVLLARSPARGLSAFTAVSFRVDLV